MEHTFDSHMTCLNKLCRACGERSKKSRKVNQKRYLLANFKNNLLLRHRINIDKDSESKHSAPLNSPPITRSAQHSHFRCHYTDNTRTTQSQQNYTC